MSEPAYDSRKTAYLNIDHWPECIPWTGPKREYGPRCWPPIHHDNPNGVDDYPSYHTDAASIGEFYSGDVCPYCGIPLRNDRELKNQNGDSGTIFDLARDDVTIPVYHPDCWKDRQAELHGHQNQSLDTYLGP